jgi:hypothetical protein
LKKPALDKILFDELFEAHADPTETKSGTLQIMKITSVLIGVEMFMILVLIFHQSLF